MKIYKIRKFTKASKTSMLENFEISLVAKGVIAAQYNTNFNKFRAHDIVKFNQGVKLALHSMGMGF